MNIKEMRELLNNLDPVYDGVEIVVLNSEQKFRWSNTTAIASATMGFDWDAGKLLLSLVPPVDNTN